MNRNNLTEEEAERIADAYFICDRDRMKMGHMLGIGRSLDTEFLVHPLVRRKIIGAVKQMRRDGVYTREEHVTKLKEIRDKCMEGENPNYKNALMAEVAVGRAAGLYENFGGGDDPSMLEQEKAPENLSTAEIRARLNKSRHLPAPPSEAIIEQPVQRKAPAETRIDDEAF